ncbi:MAG TPA: hypothetical protein VJ506_10025 [Candidatus Limnocylindrales bacterium]|nr:hypothetical protein [Candidatus Limnocylindrales bacterium]
MHRRLTGSAAGALLALALATPTMAASPSRDQQAFVTDPYVLAECDGYDVLEQDTVSIAVDTFYDSAGNVLRTVLHANDHGIVWRSDSGAQLATYTDAGGTFTMTADGKFVFTGVLNTWTLTDGTTFRDVGRIVVAEVAPGEFEPIQVAGTFENADPCDW